MRLLVQNLLYLKVLERPTFVMVQTRFAQTIRGVFLFCGNDSHCHHLAPLFILNFFSGLPDDFVRVQRLLRTERVGVHGSFSPVSVWLCGV